MKKLIIFLFIFSIHFSAPAENITEVPTSWQVESYGALGVVLWFVPGACPSGQMLLPGTATLADHNRLYATIIAAKSANLKIFVNYTITPQSQCLISSYGLAPQ